MNNERQALDASDKPTKILNVNEKNIVSDI